ncbi:MAG: hypothetical protein WDZ83_20480 [Rhizobiaceae bacterium]
MEHSYAYLVRKSKVGRGLRSRIERIADHALDRTTTLIGSVPDIVVRLHVAEQTNFQAEATFEGDDIVIRLSQGAVDQLDGSWAAVREGWRSVLEPWPFVQNGHSIATPEWLADLSLEWLILHELTHVQLGHLRMLGCAPLVEIAAVSAPAVQLDDVLSPSELPLARLCAELQADSEASDILFGPFKDAHWLELRAKAACVVAVIALIEQADAESGAPGATHPMASTRFFLLLVQLCQYWLYEDARLETDGVQSWVRTANPPDPELYRRYREKIIEPVILDAVRIAEAARAKSLVAQLRNPLALLSDLSEAQYAEDLAEANLQSAPARQWRDLLLINEKVMTAMGYRG